MVPMDWFARYASLFYQTSFIVRIDMLHFLLPQNSVLCHFSTQLTHQTYQYNMSISQNKENILYHEEVKID